MTKTKKVVYYVLLVLMSGLFLFASYPKFIADPGEVAVFNMAHLPLWFMYFIGVAEVAGVIGLWIPKLQKLAAWSLMVIMIGAVIVTVAAMGVVMAIMPAVVGVILWYVAKLGAQKMAGVEMSSA